MEWGEFRLGDLFEVLSSKNIYHANEIENIFEEQIKNSFPYIVRTTQNNGIRGYIIENEKYLNDENTLSFAQDTFSVFYQKQKYFTGNKVKILKAKFENNSEKIMKYLTACFQKSLNDFTWGIGSTIETIAEIKISLPVTYPPNPLETMGNRENYPLTPGNKGNEKAPILGGGGNDISKIDFDFMESFIEEIEKERIEKLNNYLEITGLKDYNLTSEEEKVLKDFESGKVEWGEFKIGELFEIATGRDVIIGNVIDGNIPLISHQHDNNGITKRIEKLENRRLFNYKNTLSLADRGVFLATTQNEDFHIGTRVKALKFKEGEKEIKSRLFFVSAINKLQILFTEYSSNATDNLPNLKIQLPVSYPPNPLKIRGNRENYGNKGNEKAPILGVGGNSPDYKIMEILISAIQKIVVKDVVEYGERKV